MRFFIDSPSEFTLKGKKMSTFSVVLTIICCNVMTKIHGLDEKEKYSEDSSINEIVDKEQKPELVNGNHYYLPQQTIFGSSSKSVGLFASTSAPPLQLTINPTSSLKTLEKNTKTGEKSFFKSDDYAAPFSSYCISETPSEAQVVSAILLPSKDILQKSVVLSGHIETPSKTSNDFEPSKINNLVSISSADIVQDSDIFIGNSSDI